MTGSTFNNSGSMVHNSGTIVGPVSSGDVTIGAGHAPRPRPSRAAHGEPLIFINYRGTDEAWAARAVWRACADRIGEPLVFLDNKSIELGRPFEKPMLDAVAGCAVLLAVIGRRWYGEQAEGSRLIDRPDDWVRREVRHALAHGVPVVPVFVDGMKLEAKSLPGELKVLAQHQYHSIRRRHADSDIGDLMTRVCGLDDRLADLAGDR